MSITPSSFSEPAPELDQLIEYTEESIKKQAATIESLAADGHEVTDAAKYLSQMIGNLAALRQKKINASVG
jgi:arginine repressor